MRCRRGVSSKNRRTLAPFAGVEDRRKAAAGNMSVDGCRTDSVCCYQGGLFTGVGAATPVHTCIYSTRSIASRGIHMISYCYCCTTSTRVHCWRFFSPFSRLYTGSRNRTAAFVVYCIESLSTPAHYNITRIACSNSACSTSGCTASQQYIRVGSNSVPEYEYEYRRGRSLPETSYPSALPYTARAVLAI